MDVPDERGLKQNKHKRQSRADRGTGEMDVPDERGLELMSASARSYVTIAASARWTSRRDGIGTNVSDGIAPTIVAMTAGFGASWSPRSVHRGHADRLIVVTEIGIVATDIEPVVTEIGRDSPAGGPSSMGRMARA
jgi:hypothetical protein